MFIRAQKLHSVFSEKKAPFINSEFFECVTFDVENKEMSIKKIINYL